MKEKLIRFMAGRYGFDSLGKATLIVALIVMILSGLFESAILSLLSWALIIYTYFRLFSRNIYKDTPDPHLVRHPEEPDGTAQDPPHLQMSHLPAEDPGSERQGQDRDPLSQMPDPVHQEELIKIS